MLNSAPVTPPSARSLSLTLPAASHQSRSPSCIHVSQSHNHTHLFNSIHIPFTPFTPCLVSSLHRQSLCPRRPAPPIPHCSRDYACSLSGFHPSKIPCPLPSMSASSVPPRFNACLTKSPCSRLQVLRDFLVRLSAVYLCSALIARVKLRCLFALSLVSLVIVSVLV